MCAEDGLIVALEAETIYGERYDIGAVGGQDLWANQKFSMCIPMDGRHAESGAKTIAFRGSTLTL